MKTRGMCVLVGLWWAVCTALILAVLSLSGCAPLGREANEAATGVALLTAAIGLLLVLDAVLDRIRRRRK